MTEVTEVLTVPRGGLFTAVSLKIAQRIADGWKVGQVTFELYRPVAAARALPTPVPKTARARKRKG